ncbi:MAG: hypothetical protein IVW57_04465 [Ktedonobacterales bacterium]|nr:hypothetical protein [Ktedonobacterales bacterium]
MANSSIIAALERGHTPTYTADELASMPADMLRYALACVYEAHDAVTVHADILHELRRVLPTDAELIYRRAQRVAEELRALYVALQGEHERRNGGAA